MKRFYRDVACRADAVGWRILLDDKPLHTPGRTALSLPSADLAEAIADEWRAVGDDIDPAAMLMTGMANAAIDRIAPAPEAFAGTLAAYAETDLLCYRAAGPAGLVDRQRAAWGPILGWAEAALSVTFVLAEGVMPVDQPAATVAALAGKVRGLGPFALAPMNILTTIGGSLVAALALHERAFGAAWLWDALIVDELWEEETWGADALALQARANRRREWDAAVRFLELAAPL